MNNNKENSLSHLAPHRVGPILSPASDAIGTVNAAHSSTASRHACGLLAGRTRLPG